MHIVCALRIKQWPGKQHFCFTSAEVKFHQFIIEHKLLMHGQRIYTLEIAVKIVSH